MEERTWYLVEIFISGKASEQELSELQYLLGTNQDLFIAVSEFLEGYQDPDPQVQPADIKALIKQAEIIRGQLSWLTKVQNGAAVEPLVAGIPLYAAGNKRQAGFSAALAKEIMMFGQFFKLTIRNIRHNIGISFINISGLAMGIASAVLILLWIQNQLSYDQFHKNKDRVYQVFNRAEVNGQIGAWGGMPAIMGPTLKAEYPQVEEMARLNWVGAFVLKTKQKQLETQGFLTDPGFFKLFSFPLVKGNTATALSGIHSIVLTERLAKKLFGNADPMGKIIKVDSTANFTVTAVMKDLPNNTTFNFEYLMPWSYMKEVGWDSPNWTSNNIQTFVLLKPGISEQVANERFRDIYKIHHSDGRNQVFLHPMAKWWLYNNFENGKFTAGQITVVRLFGIIAALIMLIACINYMNLGTARSTKRAREVGIRKVSGAGKGWLVKQFLGESVMTAVLAGILGLIVVQISLPWFNYLIGKNLALPLNNPYFWLTGIGFVVFTGIIAGSYPAFYLSSYKPVHILKSTFKATGALITPRKILVVVQFTFAIAFIICTTVVYRQIGFAQHRDTGYNKENLAFVYMKGNIQKNFAAIKNDLIASRAITGITRTNSPIVDVWASTDTYQWAGKDPNSRTTFAQFLTDRNFTKTMGLPLLAGRDIDINTYPTDSAAVMLTESAVKVMGLKNPIGQPLKNLNSNFHIVGVVKDFVAGWPYELRQPIVIQGTNKLFGTIMLKLNGQNAEADNIKKISAIFKKYNPDYPFNYQFAGTTYDIRFRGEKQTGTLSAVFAGLTILISCMGLFALAACMAESRTKEIGIRKVLGASIARIATLLSKDFLVLVMIAFGIASPIAWLLMKNWLQNFPYHITLNWWIFALTGLLSIIIALLTVSYQAIKAAFSNPAESLRAE
ncbi:ABC transporter permease [Mucilaginibacter sp. BJC16-A38]|uniref:ABC transporter permease n=1 Tax=Mucilaginibacter phenanthrenivorans TaxID=1234842 RepID=UPI0021572A8D|nr:ABC transporter permease [Mucilaginibacter phenanthrenivorans]MCR8561489.1 ABC transporter permease [Mucilaginibacter phenanthrenivorans]